MSDPLSVVASVASLLDIGARTAKHLRRVIHSFRHADDELIALSNEVNDIRVVLTEVENTSQVTTILPRTQLIDALETQLDRAKTKFTELEILIQSLSQLQPSGVIETKKLAWLSKKTTAQRLQQDLKDIRQKIHGLLGIATAAGSSRIELSLESLQTSHLQYQNTLSTHLTLTSTDQQAQRLSLEQLIQQSFSNLRNEFTTHCQETNMRLKQMSAHQQETTLRLNQVSAQNMADFTSPSRAIAAPTDTNLPRHTTNQALNAQDENFISQFISFSVQRKWKCRTDCQCICHIRRTYQSPAFLNRVLGTLFLGYSGRPILGSCNNGSCHRHSSVSLEIVYYYPLWFLRRALRIIAELSYMGGPAFGLTIQRVILLSDPNYSFIKMIQTHDNQSVRTMIEGRYISPNDSFGPANTPALYEAVKSSNFDAIEILLSVGADMHSKNHHGRSPIEIAWRQLLLESNPPEVIRNMEKFFPISIAEESYEFSELHKVVLGLQHLDIHTALSKSFYRLQIHCCDSNGFTPLHWAAEKNETIIVQELLQNGAEVDSVSLGGYTPLHRCVWSTRYVTTAGDLWIKQCKVAQLLISAGADINAKDIDGYQALHIACQVSASLDLVKILIASGAPLEEPTRDGASLLACAVMDLGRDASSVIIRKRLEIIEFLIEKGTALNSRDNDGDTPLFQALFDYKAIIVDLLLSKGADHTIINNIGYTTLHMTARYSNTECARVLEQANLRGVDPEAKDKKGKTALQYVNERVSPPEGFISVFNKLLESVRRANANPIVEEVMEDVEEEFVEALEAQEGDSG